MKIGNQELSALEDTRSDAPLETSPLFFDATDLILDLLHQTTLSGIQRVQAEILCNVADGMMQRPVHFVVLSRSGVLCEVEQAAVRIVIEDLRSGAASREGIEYKVRDLLSQAVPCTVEPGHTLLELGAFWTVPGSGRLLQELKRSGVRIGVFIHDVIPIIAPEYFEAASTSLFIKSVFEALTFADFVLTTSQYNQACLAESLDWGDSRPPIHLVPLGHQLSHLTSHKPIISRNVADILGKSYVLCVGTIEARKNPTYLFNVWRMMVRSGRQNVPLLVFVGRQGWLVEDFAGQLKACNGLGGRIVVLHGVSDFELDLLYQNCLLTFFPSFVEGWGLPVGESLGHGKICLCSAAGAIPEVGGKLADYIDPYNVHDGLESLSRYLANPELRCAREREITEQFQPRSWRETVDILLESVQSTEQRPAPSEVVPAILLPPGHFMPISSNPPAVFMDRVDGRLSAELACISGWCSPDISGIRAAQPATEIRFRAALPTATKINLVLRLSAHGSDFRIRIRSSSGAETDIRVADGSEKVAILTCAVEEQNLVTVHLLSIGATLTSQADTEPSYWSLKGILYFGSVVTS